MMNWPVNITATVPGTSVGTNSGSVKFDPLQQFRCVAFGSHGDAGAYHCWLMSYEASNLEHQIGTCNSSPNGEGDSIWQAGRAPAIDDQNNVYVITANGDYDGDQLWSVCASPVRPDLKLRTGIRRSSGALGTTMPLDLGSSGPVLIRNTDLVVTADKSGILYLRHRGSMGHLGRTIPAPPRVYR
jgi:hypothetical protein